ncbi:MAG: glycoside hydrolase family 3 C-terminal domain-containing protein [Clostridia bacterium]|nr:glycoside hydrolase family 3 C-terminal domain-containing protein [Clostridia bacterium]
MLSNEAIKLRVEELLHQMTVEEKAAQMLQIPYSVVGREESLRWARLGAGSFLHVLGDNAREVQKTAMENSRLGIPVIFGIDAIHGHGLKHEATIFPSQLAAACSWDPAVAEEMGRVTAREVATDGLHWTFSPVLCLGRDTRWGRVNETFGEDPYLAGEMGYAIVKGYQGDTLDAPDSILACAKHYIGYGEAVGARDAIDTQMTYRKMKEVFMPPFQRAIDAGCATFMTAYGSIDGRSFTADPKTLKTILRDEAGFDGFVVTDWNNCESLMTQQFVAKDMAEASILSAEAGNDMIMSTPAFYEAAIEAVRSGRLDEAVLDEAVRHILTLKLRMNLFEKPEKTGVPGCFGCQEHLDAARRAARRTITLLKNEGVLPLKGVKKVAVIGQNADDVQSQYGDWTYFTHPNPHEPRPPRRPYVTIKEGFEALCAERGIECVYERGCTIRPTRPMAGGAPLADPIAEAIRQQSLQRGLVPDNIPAAVEAAKASDHIVYVVGDMIDQYGEYKDRANLELSGQQMALYRELRALNIPLTVVLVASKPLCIPEIADTADAVIVAFNGGMFGGQAVAEAAFGCFNPSGRLPISFPQHSGQLPVYYNSLPGWHGGKYMDLPAAPVYAFGEGMGYSAFTYANFRFDAATLVASVDVTNAGDMAGHEVVQVYMHDVVGSVIRPVKQLIAFAHADLEAGETKTVSVQLKMNDFSLVNHDEQRVVEPGEFELFMGHSSKNEDLLKLKFNLKEDGSIQLLDKAPAVEPALTQAYLEYFLQENYSLSMSAWVGSFPNPAQILGILQQIVERKPAVEDVIDAVVETMNTRFTSIRKLEELVK